jgi:pyruvate/2-oxoglutarate dehydrogenase complex dihydrolipoamide dehydrogenase (E3) component
MTRHDAIIIGTGRSGPSLAGRLAAAGRNVAIIERKAFGGTCVNTGCIPTKTLVASAYAAHIARRADAFTHTSYNDFEIVAANLLDNDPRRVTDRITAYNLYVDPPLGRVGMTEAEVRASRRPALMAKMPMDKVGRASEKGETRGFMKILVDRETRLILGASLLGIGADEVIHTLIDLMYAKAPYTVLKRAMHIHPTVSELLPTMMSQLEPLQ